MKPKILFKTDPHGAQTLRKLERERMTPKSIGNMLFELRDDQGRFICMTGEELDSLCRGWQGTKMQAARI